MSSQTSEGVSRRKCGGGWVTPEGKSRSPQCRKRAGIFPSSPCSRDEGASKKEWDRGKQGRLRNPTRVSQRCCISSQCRVYWVSIFAAFTSVLGTWILFVLPSLPSASSPRLDERSLSASRARKNRAPYSLYLPVNFAFGQSVRRARSTSRRSPRLT